jgi:hypothetical protein
VENLKKSPLWILSPLNPYLSIKSQKYSKPFKISFFFFSFELSHNEVAFGLKKKISLLHWSQFDKQANLTKKKKKKTS